MGPGLTSMSPARRSRREVSKENLEGRGLIGEREGIVKMDKDKVSKD